MPLNLLHMRNFREYRPDGAPRNDMFLCDEEGRDWYEWRHRFKPSTMKILYAPNGDVACIVRDMEQTILMNPLDLSVIELPYNPKYFEKGKHWTFIDGKLSLHEHQ